MRYVFLIVAALTLMGCKDGMTYVGRLGDTDVYSFHSGHFDGPNWTAVLTKRDNEPTPKVQKILGGSGMGNGMVAATIDAGGEIGGNAVLDFKGTNVTNGSVNSNSSNSKGSTATGGSAAGGNGGNAASTVDQSQKSTDNHVQVDSSVHTDNSVTTDNSTHEIVH